MFSDKIKYIYIIISFSFLFNFLISIYIYNVDVPSVEIKKLKRKEKEMILYIKGGCRAISARSLVAEPRPPAEMKILEVGGLLPCINRLL